MKRRRRTFLHTYFQANFFSRSCQNVSIYSIHKHFLNVCLVCHFIFLFSLLWYCDFFLSKFITFSFYFLVNSFLLRLFIWFKTQKRKLWLLPEPEHWNNVAARNYPTISLIISSILAQHNLLNHIISSYQWDKRLRLPPKKERVGTTLNCTRWWGYSLSVLGSVVLLLYCHCFYVHSDLKLGLVSFLMAYQPPWII